MSPTKHPLMPRVGLCWNAAPTRHCLSLPAALTVTIAKLSPILVMASSMHCRKLVNPLPSPSNILFYGSISSPDPITASNSLQARTTASNISACHGSLEEINNTTKSRPSFHASRLHELNSRGPISNIPFTSSMWLL